MQRAVPITPHADDSGTPTRARTGDHDSVTSSAERELGLITLAAGALTDVVRVYPELPRPVQRDVAAAAAGFLADLRALGLEIEVTR